jgi:lysophospholipase L1-like esterase
VSPRALSVALAGLVVLMLAVLVLAAPWRTTAAPAMPAASRPPTLSATGPAAPPATPSAIADPVSDPFPRVGADPTGLTPWYLVIGDSISFGFTADPSRYGTNSSWVAQLQPLLGAGAPVPDDLACPGETTASYTTGCPQQALVPWLGGRPQEQVALAAVRAHRTTLRAIVVELGANDLLGAAANPASLSEVLTGLRTRLGTIVATLHGAAPGVPVVVADLYDPYGALNPLAGPAVDQANAVIAAVAAGNGAVLADFHAAINGSTRPLADLVDQAHADIHPTVAGHAALARAVLAAFARAGIRPAEH